MDCEGKASSIFSRLGVTSRVGGPDCSDEPAVEGLVISYASRLGAFLAGVDRFRVGTPSGHVHCVLEQRRSTRVDYGGRLRVYTCLSLAVSAPQAIRLGFVTLAESGDG